MTEVYLIRHAEAEGNLYRRIHGWYDSRITKYGMEQIALLRKRFDGVDFDAVYISDRKRTRVTAGSICLTRGIEPQETPDLREFGVGIWEDKTWGEVQKFYPEQYDLFNHDPGRFKLEGAENFHDVCRRMHRAVLTAASAHEGQRIALFSHGASIRIYIAYLLGVPSERINDVPHGDNTAVTKLIVEGDKVSIEYSNDSSHLGDASRTGRQMWWLNGGNIDTRALWYESYDPDADADTYADCCRTEYILANGSDEGFDAGCAAAASDKVRENPRSVVWACNENGKNGLIELDFYRGREEGSGFITHYCMLPESRGKLLGVQMIGHAISVYRADGRKRIVVPVPEKNENGVKFFEHYGFVQCGSENGCRLLEMKL